MFYCCIFNFFNNCYESGEIIASKKIVCGTLINHVGTQTERYIKITLIFRSNVGLFNIHIHFSARWNFKWHFNLFETHPIALLIKVIDTHKEMSNFAFVIIFQYQSAFIIFQLSVSHQFYRFSSYLTYPIQTDIARLLAIRRMILTNTDITPLLCNYLWHLFRRSLITARTFPNGYQHYPYQDNNQQPYSPS